MIIFKIHNSMMQPEIKHKRIQRFVNMINNRIKMKIKITKKQRNKKNKIKVEQ